MPACAAGSTDADLSAGPRACALGPALSSAASCFFVMPPARARTLPLTGLGSRHFGIWPFVMWNRALVRNLPARDVPDLLGSLASPFFMHGCLSLRRKQFMNMHNFCGRVLRRCEGTHHERPNRDLESSNTSRAGVFRKSRRNAPGYHTTTVEGCCAQCEDSPLEALRTPPLTESGGISPVLDSNNLSSISLKTVLLGGFSICENDASALCGKE